MSAHEDDEDSISLASTAPSEEQDVYDLESVLAEDVAEDGVTPLYLAKWLGYPVIRSTWEPAESFTDDGTLQEWAFRKRMIEEGKEKPFDLDDFEAEITAFEQAKEERAARRRDKRRRIQRTKIQGLSDKASAKKAAKAASAASPFAGLDDDITSESSTSDDSLMEELKAGRRKSSPKAEVRPSWQSRPSASTQQSTTQSARNPPLGPQSQTQKGHGVTSATSQPRPIAQMTSDSSMAAPPLPRAPAAVMTAPSLPSIGRERNVPKPGPVRHLSSAKPTRRPGDAGRDRPARSFDVLRNWTAPAPQRKLTKPSPGQKTDPKAPLFNKLSTKRRYEKASKADKAPRMDDLQLFVADKRRQSPSAKSLSSSSGAEGNEFGRGGSWSRGESTSMSPSRGDPFNEGTSTKKRRTVRFADGAREEVTSSSDVIEQDSDDTSVDMGKDSLPREQQQQQQEEHTGARAGSDEQKPPHKSISFAEYKARRQSQSSNSSQPQGQKSKDPKMLAAIAKIFPHKAFASGDKPQDNAAVHDKPEDDQLVEGQSQEKETGQHGPPDGQNVHSRPQEEEIIHEPPRTVDYAGWKKWGLLNFRELVPDDIDPEKGRHVFFLFPDRLEQEISAAARYLGQKYGVKTYLAQVEGEYERFLDEAEGGIVLLHRNCYEVCQVGNFAKVLQKEVYVFMVLGMFSEPNPMLTEDMEPHFSTTPSSFVVSALFQGRGAFILTERLFEDDSVAAWRFLRWYCALEKHRGHSSWKIHGRPGLLTWMKSRCKHYEDQFERGIITEQQPVDDRWRCYVALRDLVNADRLNLVNHTFDIRPGEIPPITTHRSPVQWADDIIKSGHTDETSYSVDELLKTFRFRISEERYFIVVDSKAEDLRTTARPDIQEPFPQQDYCGAASRQRAHLNIVTPQEFFEGSSASNGNGTPKEPLIDMIKYWKGLVRNTTLRQVVPDEVVEEIQRLMTGR